LLLKKFKKMGKLKLKTLDFPFKRDYTIINRNVSLKLEVIK